MQVFNKYIRIINEYLIWGIIFFTPLVFAWAINMQNVFELNKLVFFRLVLYILIFLITIEIFFLGYKKNKNFIIGLIFSFGLFLAFLLSTFLGANSEIAFWGNYYRQQGFFSFIHYLLFFLIVLYKIDSFQKIKSALKVVIFSSFFCCLYGVFQIAGWVDFLKWNNGIMTSGRIFSSFGQPNFFGHYLIFIIPLTVYFFFFSKKIILKVTYAGIFFLQLFCLIFTYSRSAWLGFIFILFVTFCFLLFYFWKKIKFKKIILIFLIVIIGLAGFFISGINKKEVDIDGISFKERIKSIVSLNYGSNKIRLIFWQASLKEFYSAPLKNKIFGYGLDTEQYVFAKHYEPDWAIYEKSNMIPDRAHNLIFDTILQIGLFGLTVYFLFFIYFFKKGILFLKQEKNKEKKYLVFAFFLCFSAYFINNLFSFSTTPLFVYFFFYLALGLNLFFGDNKKERVFLNFSFYFKLIVLFLLFLTLGVFAFLYNINLARADKYYFKSLKYDAQKNCEKAISHIEKARMIYNAVDYYDIFYTNQLLGCFEKEDYFHQLKKGDKNLIISLDISKNLNYNLVELLKSAHLKAMLGEVAHQDYNILSDKDIKKALDINKNFPLAYFVKAKISFLRNDYKEVIKNTDIAISLLPDINSKYLNLEHKNELKAELAIINDLKGTAFMSLGEYEDAIKSYEEIIKNKPLFFPVYKKIADIYYLKKDYKKTLYYLKRGMMLGNKDYSWPWAIAQIYKETGEKEEAIKYAELALKINKGDNKEIEEFIGDLKK
jgi:putative inorganic carbon (HCO3(-)) transporter